MSSATVWNGCMTSAAVWGPSADSSTLEVQLHWRLCCPSLSKQESVAMSWAEIVEFAWVTIKIMVSSNITPRLGAWSLKHWDTLFTSRFLDICQRFCLLKHTFYTQISKQVNTSYSLSLSYTSQYRQCVRCHYRDKVSSSMMTCRQRYFAANWCLTLSHEYSLSKPVHVCRNKVWAMLTQLAHIVDSSGEVESSRNCSRVGHNRLLLVQQVLVAMATK